TPACATRPHAVRERGDSHRPLLPVRLRYPNAPDRLRSIRLLLEFLRQFTQPLLLAILLDVVERHPVHAWSAAVFPTTRQRMFENVETIHLVVQRVEAIRGCVLRFGLQRLLQLLNR